MASATGFAVNPKYARCFEPQLPTELQSATSAPAWRGVPMTDLLAVLVLIGVPASVLLTVRMINLHYEHESAPMVDRPDTSHVGAN